MSENAFHAVSIVFAAVSVGMRTYLKSEVNVGRRIESVSAANERGRILSRCSRMVGYDGNTVVRKSCVSFCKRLHS